MTESGRNLIIIGAGGLGIITLDAALEMNLYKKIYFLDDYKEQNSLIHNCEVLGGLSKIYDINVENFEFIIAIADNGVRKTIAESHDLNYVNIIHPKSTISRFASYGQGNIILANTTIDPNVKISDYTVINKNNSIGHDSNLNDFAQISPGCSLGGYTTIQEGVFLGLGTSTLPNIKIGPFAKIGAGAMVTKNISENTLAVGVPAKVIKE